MKTYNIKVNGNLYTVEVEEVQQEVIQSKPAAEPKAVNSAAKESKPKAEAAKSIMPANNATPPKTMSRPTNGGITAPMPGTILEICVKVGEKVSAGDKIFILEAMKMENEITAVSDGIVTEIGVSKGQAVTAGQVLAAIQ